MGREEQGKKADGGCGPRGRRDLDNSDFISNGHQDGGKETRMLQAEPSSLSDDLQRRPGYSGLCTSQRQQWWWKSGMWTEQKVRKKKEIKTREAEQTSRLSLCESGPV